MGVQMCVGSGVDDVRSTMGNKSMSAYAVLSTD